MEEIHKIGTKSSGRSASSGSGKRAELSFPPILREREPSLPENLLTRVMKMRRCGEKSSWGRFYETVSAEIYGGNLFLEGFKFVGMTLGTYIYVWL
jgi:hypothetical protein